MYFEFYLDDLQIEEPQGFGEIILNMKRDDQWHGIFFEASTSDLIFYGDAAMYLMDKKRVYGLQANVTFKVLQACGVYDEPELILEGKLDFRKYVESCGTTCTVTIPVEQTGCIMTLRNRYDQKVDLDSNVAFDKITPLQNYDRLNFEMEIAPKELEAAVDGSVVGEDTTTFQITSVSAGFGVYVRPTYANERFNNIQTGQLIPVSAWETNGVALEDSAISPQLLYEDQIDCFDGEFEYDFRMKGSYSITGTGVLQLVKVKLVTWDGTGNIFDNHVEVEDVDVFTGSAPVPVSAVFDESVSGTMALTEGLGLYAILVFGHNTGPGLSAQFTVTFDEDTFFTFSAPKLCPATQANVYMVNEALSRVTEAITDNCLRVKSDYYGRTDSEPYASDQDGCGSLRILTSGLKIRRAETAKVFASLKDEFEGLRGIDNIGMGIEPNTEMPGTDWLRVEPVEYFYKDQEILSLPYIPAAQFITQEQLHYSLIKTGYKKWEVESINGLNEFNSNREYRTSLSTVSNPLDITSAFIAGGYAWEITRQQSFAATGQADTKFDNDIFIAVVEREAYGFHIEQGNIEDPENIFSPETAYNWRIRPLYNLMRWYKSIANSYPNLIDTSNKLFFTQGTGNFLASGEIAGAYPDCKLENAEKPENHDLYIGDFAREQDALPIWKPEYMAFRYPLSVNQYKTIKANPYGYLSVSCGNNTDFIPGYVQEIKFMLNKGEADIILKLRW